MTAIPHDALWDDPLPHAFSPTKHYLSHPSRSHTKAAVIFMHGRGDNANDMVDCFLPTLHKRYGGTLSRLDDLDADDAQAHGPLAVIGIEAMDNVWYPNSHNATEQVFTQQSEPYQFSALTKIKEVILDLHQSVGLPLDKIVFAGFSQGAILGNTYLLAAMNQLLNGQEGNETIPLPGYILALAGSLFKTPPQFPIRGYASDEHKNSTAAASHPAHSITQPKRIVNRILWGLADRFFSEEEIKSAAGQLSECAKKLTEKNAGVEVAVSIGPEPDQGHIITPRMVAAVVQSLDAVLGVG